MEAAKISQLKRSSKHHWGKNVAFCFTKIRLKIKFCNFGEDLINERLNKNLINKKFIFIKNGKKILAGVYYACVGIYYCFYILAAGVIACTSSMSTLRNNIGITVMRGSTSIDFFFSLFLYFHPTNSIGTIAFRTAKATLPGAALDLFSQSFLVSHVGGHPP